MKTFHSQGSDIVPKGWMHTMLRIETLETLDTKEEGGDSIMELIFDKLESQVGGLNFAKRIR